MFVIDAALANELVLIPIQEWTTAISIREVRANEVIKDDRIPLLLRELNKPTFITIDEAGFWSTKLCDRRYSIAYFAVSKDRQSIIPLLLRQLLSYAFRNLKAKTREGGRSHVSARCPSNTINSMMKSCIFST